MLNSVAQEDPTDWDMLTTNNGAVTSVYIQPYLEPYFCGNIDGDGPGPGGSDETAFELPQYVPSQYLTGNIAQSWSFQENPLSLTITLKQGIMWTGNTNIGMAPRELIASDCVFATNTQITSPAMSPYFTWIKDCVDVDQYTFKYDFASYNANWQFFLLYGGGTAFPFAPECQNAGGSNWKNAVGTGPFELTNFVDGSSVTYTKNPNYWGTTTINGQKYQEPLINTFVYLIIPDVSTQQAALETGKIDWYPYVPYAQASTLTSQAPKLVQSKYTSDQPYAFIANRLASNNPVSNLQVRQALFEATDFNSIANDVYGGGVILGWPVAEGNPSYTPLSQQSAAVQALFSFNTTAAKQMLTAAGYPNGFATTITIDSAIPQEADEAQIMTSDWAQIGVTATIDPLNSTALDAEKDNLTYAGYLCYTVGTASALTPLNWFQPKTFLGSTYAASDPLAIEASAALAEEDPVKETADVTQFCKDALLDAGIIPMTNPYVLNCYWPWLENYYGEVDAAYFNQIPMVREMWISQTLKTQDGY
jgi:peptide/nickel transport system substrate-binding protein